MAGNTDTNDTNEANASGTITQTVAGQIVSEGPSHASDILMADDIVAIRNANGLSACGLVLNNTYRGQKSRMTNAVRRRNASKDAKSAGGVNSTSWFIYDAEHPENVAPCSIIALKGGRDGSENLTPAQSMILSVIARLNVTESLGDFDAWLDYSESGSVNADRLMDVLMVGLDGIWGVEELTAYLSLFAIPEYDEASKKYLVPEVWDTEVAVTVKAYLHKLLKALGVSSAPASGVSKATIGRKWV